jgi:hypothetical protein
MHTINRSAVLVIPAQPFLDWLHHADPTSGELTLSDLRRKPTIYLLPEYEMQDEARGHLRECCGLIFEEQLNGWYRVPSAWPTDRSLANFNRWFEYSFHSVLLDLCEYRLKHESF